MLRQIRRVVRYSFIGASVIGTGLSLHNANYDWSGIGIVRFSRSAMALVEIATLYQRELFFRSWDKSSKEYREQRSKVHQKGADRLLQLCCLNRGVYVKVGQHIGALEYLLPIEYVNTMKILHSRAPANSLEEIYKVIRQDLRRDVSSFSSSFYDHLVRRRLVSWFLCVKMIHMGSVRRDPESSLSERKFDLIVRIKLQIKFQMFELNFKCSD